MMTDHDLQTRYGIKYNPFLPAIPARDLWRPPGFEAFVFRLRSLLSHGGFGVISGESGLGKSKTLHLLADWLSEHDDLSVGVMVRPQSTTGDFYRELGQLYGVDLSPANRYGGFRALRARFRKHIQTSLMRPVLLVDEAQECCSDTLTELRLLGSDNFDSVQLLTVVLCGDDRLPERFRERSLVPLGGRVRARLTLRPFEAATMSEFLDHILEQSSASALVSPGLRAALVEHSGGNLRILTVMGDELLSYAAHKELSVLDEAVFFDLFGQPRKKSRRSR